jgi:hypothetical protein
LDSSIWTSNWMDFASGPVCCKPSNRTSLGDAVDLEDSGRLIRRSNAKVKDQTCPVRSDQAGDSL